MEIFADLRLQCRLFFDRWWQSVGVAGLLNSLPLHAWQVSRFFLARMVSSPMRCLAPLYKILGAGVRSGFGTFPHEEFSGRRFNMWPDNRNGRALCMLQGLGGIVYKSCVCVCDLGQQSLALGSGIKNSGE